MRAVSRFSLLLLALLAAFTSLSPPRLRAWRYLDGALQPVPLPDDLQGIPPIINADLDQDGQPDRIDRVDSRVFIYTASEAGLPRWQSPPDWQVKQALVTDLNGDSLPELALLVWRPFQPWPVDSYLPHGGRIADHQDRRGQSCHLVLIGWLGTGFGEVWAGSALARPLRSIAAADMDGDGLQELVVLESHYNDPGFLPARSLAVWRWNGFGFDLLARSEGRFHHLEILRSPAGAILLSH